jgi:putative DNA primase/helicase
METQKKMILIPIIWFRQKFPEVYEKYGDAVKMAPKGDAISVISIYEDFFAATLGHLGNPNSPTVFVTREDRFYSYDPALGIYVSKSENQLINELSALLQQCADECNEKGICDTSSLRFSCNKSGQLSGVIKKAKGQLHVTEDYFANNLEKYIACDNGMLNLDDNVLMPFSANFRRRNKLSVKYDPNATCPLFLDTLMGQALNEADILFLQKWFGLALIGRNISQVIVILSGTAQGGKTSLAKVLIGIIGKENVASLRTEQLGQRFETASFLGKTLLHGADVPAGFLTQRSASVLKALTGGDSMTVELKNGRERPEIIGDFNVLITSNSRLVILLEGDAEAWRRRLAIIEYCKPKPQNVIPALADTILKDEGSGVLIWALEGLKQLRGDNWHFKLTPAQANVVDRALLESDSPRVFTRECLVKDDNSLLTQDDCFNRYLEYCKARDWTPMPKPKANQIIENQIMFLFAIGQRNDIRGTNGKDQRGWKGLKVK